MGIKSSVRRKINAMKEEAYEFKINHEFQSALSKYTEAISYLRNKVKDREDREIEVEKIAADVDQVYIAKIDYIISQAEQLISDKNIEEALNEFSNAQSEAERIKDYDLKKEQKERIEGLINKAEVQHNINEAESLREEKSYDKAIHVFKEALDHSKFSETKENIKSYIDLTYSEEIDSFIENAKRKKQTNDLDGAIEQYKLGLGIAENMYDASKKEAKLLYLKDLVNEVYSDRISPLLEKGKQRLDQGNEDEAVNPLKEAESYAENMFESAAKKNELKRVSETLNPVFFKKINTLIKEGREIIENPDFTDSIVDNTEALNKFNKALDMAKNDLVKSAEKSQKIDEIYNLVTKTSSTGVTARKEKALKLIEEKEYDKAINEMYSALSVAKKMSEDEEENPDIMIIKDVINMVYTAEINDIIGKGDDLIEEKRYDDAIEEYKKALHVTNKMYLGEAMSAQTNRVKDLIYQTELKKVISDGNISEEQVKFQEQIQQLSKSLETTKLIEDDDLRNEEMINIRLKIDKVHSEEITFLIERGKSLIEEGKYGESSGLLDKAIEVIELIKRKESKQEEYIKVVDAILSIAEKALKRDKLGLAYESLEFPLKFIDKIDDEDLENVQYVKLIDELLKIANVSVEKNNYEQSYRDYEKALDLVELIKEDEKLKQKKLSEIKENYKTNLKNHAKINLDQTNYEKTVELCKKALELDKDYIKAYYYRAIAYKRMKQYDLAVENFQEAVELNPSHYKAWNKLGLAYFFKKNYTNAIDCFTRSIDLKGEFINAWYNLANAYKDSGNYEKALESYDKVLGLDSQYANAWFFKGMVYYTMKNYEQAIVNLRKAIEIDSSLDNEIRSLINLFEETTEKISKKLEEVYNIQAK